MFLIKEKLSKRRIIFVLLIYFGIVFIPTKVISSSFCRDYADENTSWFESKYRYEWDKNYDYCLYVEDDLIKAYERDRDNFFPLFIVDSFNSIVVDNFNAIKNWINAYQRDIKDSKRREQIDKDFENYINKMKKY